MVKDGEDWHGLQMTNLKNLGWTFKIGKPCSFNWSSAPGPPEKLTCIITRDNNVHVKWDPPEDNLFLYSVLGYILQSSSGKCVWDQIPVWLAFNDNLSWTELSGDETTKTAFSTNWAKI